MIMDITVYCVLPSTNHAARAGVPWSLGVDISSAPNSCAISALLSTPRPLDAAFSSAPPLHHPK